MLKFLKAKASSRVDDDSPGSDLHPAIPKISISDLIATLTTLRRSGRKISAQFEDDNDIFNCNLGAFDYKYRSLVLSNVYSSRSAAIQIFPGKVLNLFLPLQGHTVKMSCTLVAPLLPNEHSMLQVTMPKKPAFVFSRIHLGLFFQRYRATI